MSLPFKGQNQQHFSNEDHFVKVRGISKIQVVEHVKYSRWVGFQYHTTCRTIRESRDRELSNKEKNNCKLGLSFEKSGFA